MGRYIKSIVFSQSKVVKYLKIRHNTVSSNMKAQQTDQAHPVGVPVTFIQIKSSKLCS